MAGRYAGFLALALLGATGACSGSNGETNSAANVLDAAPKTIAVTITSRNGTSRNGTSRNGTHVFAVELAKTPDEQERGLMYRTDIAQNGGMLFSPLPPGGGPPQVASFWMKNTPSPLDILFIRPDGTIARIAENTVPQSETPIPSGEPVNAVLELRGGRTLELGIAEGDRVAWAKR